MTPRLLVPLAVFAFVVCRPRFSVAETSVHTGFQCVRGSFSASNNYGYNDFSPQSGIINFDTSNALVTYCPLNYINNSSGGDGYLSTSVLGSMLVNFRDRSSSQAVSCHMYGRDFGGTTYFAGGRYSCGTFGGCSSNTNPGYVTGSSQNSDFMMLPTPPDSTYIAVYMVCTMPPSGGTVATSSPLQGYRLVYTPSN